MAYLHPDKLLSVGRIVARKKARKQVTKKKSSAPAPGLVTALAVKAYIERAGKDGS